ncbi:MAG: phosphate ABC transporter permease PstA [Chromatiales bacterium]|nr:phosphate ABC transporter permease PstA [Chromatiales bacterium]
MENISYTEQIKHSLKRRYYKEQLFKLMAMLTTLFGIALLVMIIGGLIYQARNAFQQTYIELDINIPSSKDSTLTSSSYQKATKEALYLLFPDVQSRTDRLSLGKLISSGAQYEIIEMLANRSDTQRSDAQAQTMTLDILADDELDGYIKSGDSPTERRTFRLSEQQVAWAEQLVADDRIKLKFNTNFFTKGDSRDPERAGILGAIVGSFYALLVAFLISFPLGIATAIYLEEFAPKNRYTDFIEININNLAAVPSIIFGLLGLVIFLNFFNLPRSTPLVGGLVLSLMTLPTIIIAARAALKSVPPSIREGALAVGASKMQTTLHHVLPLAMPSILTGSIIGMAQALGETAPLLIIGMMAFIVDVPSAITDPATALPVQIYLWADSPERAFVDRTAGAIVVLLLFLVAMNLFAVWARKVLEIKY